MADFHPHELDQEYGTMLIPGSGNPTTLGIVAPGGSVFLDRGGAIYVTNGTTWSLVTGSYLLTTGGTLTGRLNVSASVGVSGQVRAAGWFTTGDMTGPAAELGYNAGVALLLGYNRTTSAYIPLQIAASSVTIVNSDLLVSAGRIIAGAYGITPPMSVGDFVARRSATTGAYYFGENSAAYLYFDGTGYTLGGANGTAGSGLGTFTVQSWIGFNVCGVGGPYGYIAVAQSANSMVTGSATGDVVIRSQSQRILFTTDAGVSTCANFDSNGYFISRYNYPIYGTVGQYNPAYLRLIYAIGDAYKPTAVNGSGMITSASNLYGLVCAYDDTGGTGPNLSGHSLGHGIAWYSSGTYYSFFGQNGIHTTGTIDAGGVIRQQGVTVAKVVYSSVAPTSSDNYPDGTLWIVR